MDNSENHRHVMATYRMMVKLRSAQNSKLKQQKVSLHPNLQKKNLKKE